MLAKRSTPKHKPGSVLVIGLGRFGTSVGANLVARGVDVVAIDEDMARVERYADELTYTVQADATDGEAMRQLGVRQFDQAVVAIGTDVEASVLTVVTLVEAGVQEIWAKAITRKHGKILTSVGATHVVYPENSMGKKVAHVIAGGMRDYFEFDDGFAIARTDAPKPTWDKSLDDAGVRSRYNVTVVGLKRAGEDFTYAVPTTVLRRGDELVLSGMREDLEKFCALPKE